MNLFPVTGVPPWIYFPWEGFPPADKRFFFFLLGFPDEEMVVDHEGRQPGESLRSLQEVYNQRITNVADQYFTNLCRVGGSQGRGAPSIEYRDRQKAKAACVKTFVEKYDTVTVPSGEGQDVRKEMTVQVEQWFNSSDVTTSLREENTWGVDGTVVVLGKRKKLFLMEGLQHQHKQWSTTSRHSYWTTTPTWKKRLSSMGISTDRAPLPELIHLFPLTELLSLN